MSEEQPIVDVTVSEEWKKYFNTLSDKRIRDVTQLAKQDEFNIDILDEQSGSWTTKLYKYREIPSLKWIELEQIRAKHGDLTKLAASKLFDKEKNVYDFAEKMTQLNTELYKKSAKYFLNMTESEFDNSKWVQIRDIIDACNHRTVYSLPN